MMKQQATVDRQALVAQMQQRMEQTMRQVADAVNAAPDGHWIEDSEDAVWELMEDLKRDAFQTALQMRADAAEASFSPSDR